MSNTHDPSDEVITSYKDAPAKSVDAAGTTFAYRELGPKGGVPVVFFVHLAATLDNWDPRITYGPAQRAPLQASADPWGSPSRGTRAVVVRPLGWSPSAASKR